MSYDPYPTRIQYPTYAQPTPPPEPRRLWWPYALLAAAVVFLAGGVWTAYDRGLIFKDSGIKACESLRDGTASVKGVDKPNEKITEAQYRKMREVFADSRYDDIRDHGTKLMDVIWQMTTNVSDNADSGESLGAALAYMQPLMTHVTGLQSACADQGIIVNIAANKKAN